MEWGKKKSASPSPHHSLITRVFPVSWLAKFKQAEPNSAEKKQNFPSPRSFSWKEGRLCNVDDDAYWKLSFVDGRIESWKNAGGMKTVWYYSGDELGANEMTRAENHKLTKELRHSMRNLRRNDASRRKRSNGKGKNDKNSTNLEEKRAKSKTGLDEEKLSKLIEKDIFEIAPETVVQRKEKDFLKSAGSNSKKQHCFFFPDSSPRTIEEDCAFEALNLEGNNAVPEENLNSEWQQL